MAKALALRASLIALGGVILGLYALFIRYDKPSPDIGAGVVVLFAYGLIGAGVVLIIAYFVQKT